MREFKQHAANRGLFIRPANCNIVARQFDMFLRTIGSRVIMGKKIIVCNQIIVFANTTYKEMSVEEKLFFFFNATTIYTYGANILWVLKGFLPVLFLEATNLVSIKETTKVTD